MNFCDVCGKEVADTATVCPVCGASITPLATPTAQQFVPPQYPAQPVQQQYNPQPTQQQYPTQQSQPIYNPQQQYNPQPTQPQYPVQSQYPMQPTQQMYQYPTQQMQPMYQYPMRPAPVSKAAKILANIAFALGLFSIIFCWFCWVPDSGYRLGAYCIEFSIASLILASISKKKGTVKRATVAKILSIISLIVAIITTIISIATTTNFDDDDDFDLIDNDNYYSDYNNDFEDNDWLDYTNS